MSKFVFNFFVGIIFIFSLGIGTVFANGVPDNQALFATLQRELAGDPAAWSVRTRDDNQNIVPSSFGPGQVQAREERFRTTTDEKDRETFNTSSWMPGEIIRKAWIFDPKSGVGSFIRDLTENKIYDDSYILTTFREDELGIIKDLYGQITGRVTQFGNPSGGNSLNSCLREGKGVCRHMASILDESLKNAGIESTLMISPDHFWVRVTLSEPPYEGLIFDLDPTWYQQPIPLAPRERSSMTPVWRDMMLAVTASSSGTLNLNGRWRSGSGTILEVRHVGSGVVSIVRESDDPTTVGRVSFTGTLAEYILTGTQLFRAEQCPGLERQSPASGSVSTDGNTISLNAVAKIYYVDSCTYTGETQKSNSTLTRVE